jgi:hypothetical protein
MKIQTNDPRLSLILKKFEDAAKQGMVSRMMYGDFKVVRNYLVNGVCCDCGDHVNYFYLDSHGSLMCPECEEEFVPFRYSPYIGVELRNLYKSMTVGPTTETVSLQGGKLVETVKLANGKEIKVSNMQEPVENTNIKSEGENNMMNLNMGGMFKNLKFGPVAGDDFRLSPLGTAFKTADGYSVYNTEKQELTDVTGMVFNMQNAIFAMPVAHKKVKVNDVIIHQGTAVVVTEIKDKTLMVVNPFASEVREVMPTKSMFGFNFYTRISALFDLGKADEENPFGNVMPLMMMSGAGANGEGGMNPMMMAMMMSGAMGGKDKDGEDGDNMFGNMDPMMMMAMCGGMGNGNQNGNANANGMDMGGMMMAMAMTKMFK